MNNQPLNYYIYARSSKKVCQGCESYEYCTAYNIRPHRIRRGKNGVHTYECPHYERKES